ncbi:MAG: hypothetical protein M3345_02220 [Actinomycetota bacterium]|nr:hypothetical protein [Actinomycetota bacterium]
MNEPSVVRQRVACVVMAIVICLIWWFAYVAASELSDEYGAGVVEWDTLFALALIVGGVTGALSLPVFTRLSMRRQMAVVVGALAALGLVVAGLLGRSAGGEVHERLQQTVAQSCSGGARAATLVFAREAGRVVPTNGQLAIPSSNGCAVAVAVERTSGTDPLDTIDDAVADDGWEREGRSTWVDQEGFTLEVSVEPAGPRDAEHAVNIFGSRR